jgi:hypothetical protein
MGERTISQSMAVAAAVVVAAALYRWKLQQNAVERKRCSFEEKQGKVRENNFHKFFSFDKVVRLMTSSDNYN